MVLVWCDFVWFLSGSFGLLVRLDQICLAIAINSLLLDVIEQVTFKMRHHINCPFNDVRLETFASMQRHFVSMELMHLLANVN